MALTREQTRSLARWLLKTSGLFSGKDTKRKKHAPKMSLFGTLRTKAVTVAEVAPRRGDLTRAIRTQLEQFDRPG